MSMMFRTQFGDLFLERLPILREVVFDRYRRWPVQYTQFFDVQGTDQPFENYTGISGLGLFQEVDEGTDVPVDSVRQLFDKKLQPIKYGLSVEHTRELLEDDKFGVFTKMGKLMGDMSRLSDEILAADLAEQGDTNSAALYLSADGDNIFDTAHDIDVGSTYSNLNTAADLSSTSLQTALINLEDTVDDRGIQMMIQGNLLVVPTDVRFKAATLVKSMDDSETADRSISPFVDDSLSYKVWRYLTDDDAWYLWSDYPRITEGWIWLNRRPLDMNHDVNVRNETAVSVATKRLIYGVVDWRGVSKTPGS